MAWVFLTLGIALGSWWAYYELGWGGWWFWDPVENASFMPWLTATALIHSLASTDNRGLFKAWTVLLAILSFSLSLLGTFLVRSGVLTSVHAFASDPTRGIFILMLLGIVVGASLSIFASHGQRIRSHQGFAMLSREAGLLLNNILLLVITGAILLGTLYPLLIDALGLGKLSVGPPYFNAIFLPLGGMLMGLLGAGSWLHWKQDRPERVLSLLRWPFWASLAGSVALSLCLPDFNPGALLCIWLALWVTLTTLGGLLDKGRHGLGRISRSQWGMVVAHLGLAILAVGIGLTSIYSTEQTVRLAPGESLTLSGYRFTFEGTRTVMGPNYRAIEGRLEVQKAGAPVTAMLPQKRFYHAMPGNPMTEAAIDPGIGRDLFVALGEDLGEQGAWSLRIYHKPFVSWIWASAFFMATGGLLALSDRRYRKTRIQQQQARPATPAQGMEVGA
jgi:cytochrome c-type biogenesis protein CcmF